MPGNEAPFPEPIITRVEETRLVGFYPSTGNWLSIEVDSNGKPVVKQVDSAGNIIDPATEGTVSAIAGALSSNGSDDIRVATPAPIDVSGATVPTEQQTPVKVENSAGSTIDPLAKADQPFDVSAATVTVDDSGAFAISATPLDGSLGSNATDSLLVQENTPLDVSGAQVDVDIATQTLARIIGELELEDAGATGTYANIHRRGSALQVSLENNQAGTLAVEQQTPVGVEDSAGAQIDPARKENASTTYTTVDLNTTGTTTIYSSTTPARVKTAFMNNPGGTNSVRLEVTDGTNTAVLHDPGSGADLSHRDEILLTAAESLQVVVETAEGSSLTTDAHVSSGEL